ncbi:MAG: hypothetical protein FWD67_10995 [Betaproteobacteria bacterium]|nr:hypothetical protein [Betaproteobacteria bacterium]
MSGHKWFQAGWLRKAGIAALWCLGVLGVLVAINVAGIALAGSVGRWQAWIGSHANLFLAWRLILYANIAAGWVWMRRQVLAREPGRDTQWRLAQVELTCILVVVLLEAAQVMKGALS